MAVPQPYISASENVREWSWRGVIAGILFGIVFGVANAYLGLRVGLTISTSIPIVVMSVAFFKLIERPFGKTTILENNMSQTIGSASSSVASGIIWTIPALFLWGLDPAIAQIGALGLLGGILGVLFMIPLRRFLIVDEHDNLPFPEGTACYHVLVAAEERGTKARDIFVGMGVGGLYKAMAGMVGLWKEKFSFSIAGISKAVIGVEVSPALVGVGFILNYRVAAIMVAGGLLSWLVLIPMIATFGQGFIEPFHPELQKTIAAMSAKEIWNRYIRYIGAGAVTVGGLITVAKALPTMVSSFRLVVREAFGHRRIDFSGRLRTERDLPMLAVFGGALAVLVIIALVPQLLGIGNPLVIRVLCSITIIVFAFLFVTVSSRLVGLIGVTSNPTSAMTIVSLLGTTLLFFLLGWTDTAAKVTALCVGTVVAVAASIAGDTSQDLKTGFLAGATPSRQQIGELIGVLTSAFFVAGTVWLLAKLYGFGTAQIPAPQATLMKTVIDGVLRADLPWELVFIGAGIGLIAELMGIPSLPFAVGIYLPLDTMTPVYLGGLIRRFLERRLRHDAARCEAACNSGVLLGSGMIAGEGLMGVGIAVYAFFFGGADELLVAFPAHILEWLTPFALLSLLLFFYRRATRA